MSYGIESLTEALVADLVTRRLGKLKSEHVDITDWNLALGIDADTAKKSIGLMAANGSVKTVSFDSYVNGAQGIVVLGRYQHVRSRGMQLVQVITDNIYPGMPYTAKVMTSLKGKRTDFVTTLTAQESDVLSRDHLCNVSGQAHSLAIQGSFDLNSVVLTYALAGDR